MATTSPLIERDSRPEFSETETTAIRETTRLIAQTLFEYYRQYSFNIDEWISCLQSTIGGSGKSVSIQVQARIESILEDGKKIPLAKIDEHAKKELMREVAEWLAAEKFAERMLAYEQDVQDKIRTREYSRIRIEEVILRNDDNLYEDDIAGFIEENYVIDTNSYNTVGMGARVKVHNLIPVHFPFPVPKEDEVGDGLMIKIPNNGLVIRMVHEAYRMLTKRQAGLHQRPQIESLRTAINGKIFDMAKLEQREHEFDIRQRLVHRINGEPAFSFIPPFVILRVSVEEGQSPEYATIQKKIPTNMPDQYVHPGNKYFTDDLKKNPRLRRKLQQFIEACKDFYDREKKLPDLRGRGNILYTEKGNINLVDINNISDEPNYTAVAYLKLINELVRMKFCSMKKEDHQKMAEKLEEIMDEAAPILQRFGLEDREETKKLASNVTYYDNDKNVRKLFQRMGIMDEIEYPIFWENIKLLFELEQLQLQLRLDEGEITKEEHDQATSDLQKQEIYQILIPAGYPEGTNVYQKGDYGQLNPIMELKEKNDPTWTIRMAHELFAFIDRVQRGSNELYED